MKKNSLPILSYIVDWFKAFLVNKIYKTIKYGTDLWTTCMNLKGLLLNIGHHSHKYSTLVH